VQEDLDDARALVGEQAFELLDVVVPPPPPLLGHELVHAHGYDVLVVRPVEDADLAVAGAVGVDTPEVVLARLAARRHLEAHDAHTLRVDPGEHAADGAVLAAGVDGLEDHEQRPLLLGPQALLELEQAEMERGQLDRRLRLVGEAELVVGGSLVESSGGAWFDEQLGNHAGRRYC
jgi:hypothetical protein